MIYLIKTDELVRRVVVSRFAELYKPQRVSFRSN
jgi:hypothetical protein